MTAPAKSPEISAASPLDRLKVLINSSTPIVVMETVEEVRALALGAHGFAPSSTWLSSSGVSLTDWSGLVWRRCSVPAKAGQRSASTRTTLTASAIQKDRRIQHHRSCASTRDMEAMTLEAVFVLKGFSSAHGTIPWWCAASAMSGRSSPRIAGRWC